MDRKDLLKSMLQNFINDKEDAAKSDFHQYLAIRSREVAGIGNSQPEPRTASTDVDDAENQE